jgi:cation diffusion facilitator CzcD-associated flavoprotein CzcO
VAVIGIGSSAVQIVPKLAPSRQYSPLGAIQTNSMIVVKNLTSFIRSKTWISPTPGINEPTASDPEMDEKLNFAPHELERFKRDPEYLLHLRRAISDRRMQNFGRSVAASELQANAQSLFRRVMKERLGNSEKGRRLAELIIPDYPIGCRRQTPGPNYLESLVRDNVDTKWDDIERITERGIMTRSGEELEFDAIVCATGFRTSFQPRFPVIGRGGASLGKQYDNIPEAYFGMTTPNFPNFFSKCFVSVY